MRAERCRAAGHIASPTRRDRTTTRSSVPGPGSWSGRVAIRTHARKVILDLESLEPVAHFDLARDPGERTSIPIDDEAEQLVSLARSRIVNGHASLRRPGKTQLDPSLQQRLEALGYMKEGDRPGDGREGPPEE